MPDEDLRPTGEILTLVLMFGGADRGAGGIGITGGGKLKRIPPRQDLVAIPDDMLAEAIGVLAQGISDEATKTAIERAAAQA